jgi:hypothetical protein
VNKLRRQVILQPAPNLAVRSPGAVNSAVPGPGRPVPKGFRGTEFADRNPMFDTEARGQDEGEDAIRTQQHMKGVV